MNILQRIFLSSEGNGAVSLSWGALLIFILAYFAPNASANDLTQAADLIMKIGSALGTIYGLYRKYQNGRWSAPLGG